MVAVRTISDVTSIAAWGRYVDGRNDASFFHHPDWSLTVEKIFGHRPRHLRATRNGQIVGVLPLVEVQSLFGGRLWVSVPYGTYGGILADDDEAATALANETMRLAEECDARLVDLRSARATAPGFEPVPGYLGFTRDLPLHPNEVSASLPKRARAAARHARDRDGVTVQHDAKLLKIVWQLYCRSMRRIASINYPYKFFVQLAERFSDRAWVTVAWKGEQPVCGTFSLVFRDTVMPYILGADERIRCDGAANLLYWSVMERAVRSGLHRFDYGRSRADNKGAVGFKKNQGFTPHELQYQRFVPAGRKAPDLKPSNPKFALARRMWPRLPLSMTKVLGARLSRSIPG